MKNKFTLDDAIDVLHDRGLSLDQSDVDNIVHQLMYQKELNLVYTESVSSLVNKLASFKMEKDAERLGN